MILKHMLEVQLHGPTELKTYDCDYQQQPYQNNLALTFISTCGSGELFLILQC